MPRAIRTLRRRDWSRADVDRRTAFRPCGGWLRRPRSTWEWFGEGAAFCGLRRCAGVRSTAFRLSAHRVPAWRRMASPAPQRPGSASVKARPSAVCGVARAFAARLSGFQRTAFRPGGGWLRRPRSTWEWFGEGAAFCGLRRCAGVRSTAFRLSAHRVPAWRRMASPAPQRPGSASVKARPSAVCGVARAFAARLSGFQRTAFRPGGGWLRRPRSGLGVLR